MPVELIPSIEIINDNTYKTYSVYQANTKQISEIELSRIKSKQAQLYEEEENAKRMVQLNTSYRYKQQAYITMLLVFLLMLFISFVLFWIKQMFEIKSNIIEILIVFVVAGSLLSIFFQYLNILSRDNIYFDKLGKTSLAKVADIGNIESETTNNVHISNLNPVCRGAECCGP